MSDIWEALRIAYDALPNVLKMPWAIHVLSYVVIFKQDLKFHTLNTDLEHVEIPTIKTDDDGLDDILIL